MMRLDREWPKAAAADQDDKELPECLMSSFNLALIEYRFYSLVAAVSFKVCHVVGKNTCQQTGYTI